MPNIKSAKKRVLVNAERHAINVAKRSALKTSLKKATASITAADQANSAIDLKNAIKNLDIAVNNGLVHKNQAARRKSRLTKKFNAISK